MASFIEDVDKLLADGPLPHPTVFALHGPAYGFREVFDDDRILARGPNTPMYFLVTITPDERVLAYTVGWSAEWAVDMIRLANTSIPDLEDNAPDECRALPDVHDQLVTAGLSG